MVRAPNFGLTDCSSMPRELCNCTCTYSARSLLIPPTTHRTYTKLQWTAEAGRQNICLHEAKPCHSTIVQP